MKRQPGAGCGLSSSAPLLSEETVCGGDAGLRPIASLLFLTGSFLIFWFPPPPPHTSHRPVLFLSSEKCDRFELQCRPRGQHQLPLRTPGDSHFTSRGRREGSEGPAPELLAAGSGGTEMSQIPGAHTRSLSSFVTEGGSEAGGCH